MSKPLFLPLLFLLAAAWGALDAHAAMIPQEWSVEVSRIKQYQFEANRGDTMELKATFWHKGEPFDLGGDTFRLYWQTNGMERFYWSVPAVSASNTVSAVFANTMDPGAPIVYGFLGATSGNYRASFAIRYAPGPGAVPNALPLPAATIDFSKVVALNAPWLLPSATNGFIKVEIDPTVPGATNALNASLSSRLSLASAAATNYTDEAVAAQSAAQSAALADATNALSAALSAADAVISRDANAYTDDEIGDLKRNLENGGIAVGEATRAYKATDADYAAALLSPDGMWMRNAREIIIQIDAAIATNARQNAAIESIDVMSGIAATNATFSNAVLSVGLGIDTNTVAAINALVEAGDELPIGGATSVGALLLALAAAVAALKRTKADASALRYAMPAPVELVPENDAATLVCADRAVSNATIASGFSTLNLDFPAAVSGYVRDFYLRIVVAAGQSAPAISVPLDVTIENAGGAVPVIADGEASAAATTLVWFSETAPGVFTAKNETVSAVA